jgi:acetyltransferase-like isoleucine patch superfamily enzyme
MYLKKIFFKLLGLRINRFHPLVFISGNPTIGKNCYIGLFSEIYSKVAHVYIGDNCDIASFVSVNSSDSHKKCIGLNKNIFSKDIIIENNVFIGSHSFIKPGARIGHHSVVAAGTIVEGKKIPAFSLIYGNPMKIKKGYYKK